jgi:hypothetical protein
MKQMSHRYVTAALLGVVALVVSARADVVTNTWITPGGGGTVTLPSPTATGTWVIGQGAEVVDNGTGDLAARWTVTNLGANRKTRFKTDGGAFTCTVIGAKDSK